MPIELLDSMRLLAGARYEYLDAIVDYNEAQFSLYVAAGSRRPIPWRDRSRTRELWFSDAQRASTRGHSTGANHDRAESSGFHDRMRQVLWLTAVVTAPGGLREPPSRGVAASDEAGRPRFSGPGRPEVTTTTPAPAPATIRVTTTAATTTDTPPTSAASPIASYPVVPPRRSFRSI